MAPVVVIKTALRQKGTSREDKLFDKVTDVYHIITLFLTYLIEAYP